MRNCAYNKGIANMRAGRKITRQRIAIQLHQLVGRSKKHSVNNQALSL